MGITISNSQGLWLGFSLWSTALHLWVMRVYIVWVKGREVTLKNPLGREGLTHETLAKTTAWHDSSTSSHVLLTWLFCGLASRELLAKSIDSSFKLDSSPT